MEMFFVAVQFTLGVLATLGMVGCGLLLLDWVLGVLRC